MVDTNALLGIAFSLVANFTNIVEVKPQALPAVPQSINDLAQYVIGSPHSPVEVYMVSRAGAIFQIRDGSVDYFRTPGSYFGLQDPEQITNFLGKAKLTSNEVVALATSTLSRLTKSNDGPTLGPPIVTMAGEFKNQFIAYYRITWPPTGKDRHSRVWGYSAQIDIDARKGRIQNLELIDPRFHDYVLDKRIRDQCYKPEPRPPPPPLEIKPLGWPHPSTNEVTDGISNWLHVCQRLSVKPGSQTNLAEVNWDHTGIQEKGLDFATGRVCRVTFTNGAAFDSVDGMILDYIAADQFYNIDFQHRDVKPFWGHLNYEWKDLASRFEKTLESEFGFPPEMIATYHAVFPAVGTDTSGPDGLTRCLVSWRKLPNRKLKPDETVSLNETALGLLVEFDLQTGDIKTFAFKNAEFAAPFLKAQRVIGSKDK